MTPEAAEPPPPPPPRSPPPPRPPRARPAAAPPAVRRGARGARRRLSAAALPRFPGFAAALGRRRPRRRRPLRAAGPAPPGAAPPAAAGRAAPSRAPRRRLPSRASRICFAATISGSIARARSAKVRARRWSPRSQGDAGQTGDRDRVRGVQLDELPVRPLGLVERSARQGLVGLQQHLEHQRASFMRSERGTSDSPPAGPSTSARARSSRIARSLSAGSAIDPLRELVQYPAERSAGRDAQLRPEVVAVDGKLIPAQDGVGGQLLADPRAPARAEGRLRPKARCPRCPRLAAPAGRRSSPGRPFG